MNEKEFVEFSEDLSAFASVCKIELTTGMLGMYWLALREFSYADLKKAFLDHVKTSPYFPKPADLCERLQPASAHIGADEAWSMMPMGEGDTVVWTDEMREAFFIAADLLETDHIAARMAFRDAYERIVKESRALGKPVKWTVSLGHDPRKREAVIQEAARCGRLTASEAQHYLPAPAYGDEALALIGKAQLRIAASGGQVVDNSQVTPQEKAREHLEHLKNILGKKGVA